DVLDVGIPFECRLESAGAGGGAFGLVSSGYDGIDLELHVGGHNRGRAGNAANGAARPGCVIASSRRGIAVLVIPLDAEFAVLSVDTRTVVVCHALRVVVDLGFDDVVVIIGDVGLRHCIGAKGVGVRGA